MKRRDSRAAAKKGWRVRKQMRAAREDFSMKPGQSREDWAREHDIDLAWSEKWGRANWRSVLPNPFLTRE
jgi:hypothetical protein